MKGVPFTLHPLIEDLNTQVMYESDCEKVKLQFAWNTIIVSDRLKALVMMDPYNSLEADIHKYLVGYGGALILVNCYRREYHSEIEVNVLGCSQTI